MPEHTTPLRADQPDVLAYEGYHHNTKYDYFWYVEPDTRVGAHVYVECIPGIQPRAYIKNAYLLDIDSVIRLTHLQTCALRFMAGEVEKWEDAVFTKEAAARVAALIEDTPPARQDAATESETRGADIPQAGR